jgi:hypothetical protein
MNPWRHEAIKPDSQETRNPWCNDDLTPWRSDLIWRHEATKSWSQEAVKLWRFEATKPQSHEVMKPLSHEAFRPCNHDTMKPGRLGARKSWSMKPCSQLSMRCRWRRWLTVLLLVDTRWFVAKEQTFSSSTVRAHLVRSISWLKHDSRGTKDSGAAVILFQKYKCNYYTVVLAVECGYLSVLSGPGHRIFGGSMD